MMTPEELYSFTPLMNSFLLEWKESSYSAPYITVPTKNGTLSIEVSHYSLVGHHRYTGVIKQNNSSLTFFEFLNLLTELLGLASDNNFSKRVKESHKCITEAIRLNGESFKNILPHFKETETSLFIGHSLHPTPKSRSQFTTQDLSHFSPEHGGMFHLSWIQVHHSIFFERYSNFFEDLKWQQRLCSLKADEEYVLLPVHPWQKEILFQLEIIKEYLAKDLIRILDEDERFWVPTSSLRTVYNDQADYMIKFSLSVKMTNSIRLLLRHELERGLQIHEICQHHHLTPFFEEFEHFQIIQEPYFAGIQDLQGNPIPESLIMLRENPIKKEDEVSLIAALTQPTVEGGRNLLKDLVRRSQLDPSTWFEEYLDKAIAPLIVAQGKFGLLLGAHQQNLLLRLNTGKPVGAYFRDCHGTGYDMKKIAGIVSELEKITEENGNLLPDDVSHALFGYYVIINSVFNMISAIAQNLEVQECDLLEVYKTFLTKIKSRAKIDPAFIDYLLQNKTLKHKGNFFCTVNAINENTASNPLNIYTDIENPLKRTKYGN